MWKVLLIIPFFVAIGNTNDCQRHYFDKDKIVCVCNATYCDSTPDNDPKIPPNGTFYWYTSSKDGLRLNFRKGQIDSCGKSAHPVTLTVNPTKKYQRILGFGSAFTDAAGINIKKLSQPTQDQLIRSYFDSKGGSKYSLGRLGIGGIDFSTRPYTYDDHHPNDVKLEHFALAQEDYDYKIPFMQKARELNPNLKFVSAVWSPPAWMKSNNQLNGLGLLKLEYYQTYADYIVKFLDEYKKHGLDIWAVSTGNEPLNAFIPFSTINSMGWTPLNVATWVANYMGPTLNASTHDTKILILDDQRVLLPWFVEGVFQNKNAKDYVAGIASHWYTDFITSPDVLNETHNLFPDKFILMTEACTGSQSKNYPTVLLGSWDRGETYFLSIIEYMNHWSIGWLDWNLALDKDGGPNWINNFVDSPIIVNPESDEFFKQPMYYAIKHFSRFVDRDSVKIDINETETIKSTAFTTPSNETVVQLYNRNDIPRNVVLKDVTTNGSICLELPAYSMNTIIYS